MMRDSDTCGCMLYLLRIRITKIYFGPWLDVVHVDVNSVSGLSAVHIGQSSLLNAEVWWTHRSLPWLLCPTVGALSLHVNKTNTQTHHRKKSINALLGSCTTSVHEMWPYCA